MKPQRTTAELLERAAAHHGAGRAKEAEAFYRKVLARKPQHERALFMLSGLLFEAGRFGEAALLLERLVAIAPHPAYLTNLGEAYRRQGQLEPAAAACRRALAADPELPEAHHNLGLTLMNAEAPDQNPKNTSHDLLVCAHLLPVSHCARIDTLHWLITADSAAYRS